MKKGLRSIAVLALSALALTSCTSKVEFSEFKTKATEAAGKTCEYTTAKLTGKIDDKDIGTFNFTISSRVLVPSKDTTLANTASAVAYALALNTYFNINVYTAADLGTGYTYYAGDAFKVEYKYTDDSKNTVTSTYEWNSIGLPTAINGKAASSDSKSTYNVKVSYSK